MGNSQLFCTLISESCNHFQWAQDDPRRTVPHMPWLRRLAAVCLCALSATLLPPIAAGEPAAAPASAPDIPFRKYELDNGLEVILHQDRSLPLVAVNLWYHVGPANEPPGRSGFAHLFEHLMFEGSRHVGHRFDELLESAGATNVNGTTSWDRTDYFETVPRRYLELALWIESDRMGFMLDTLTPDRMEVQRDVVKNERRQSYENAPYGPTSLALSDAMFPEGHPYHGAIIGSMKDLDAAKMKDVEDFFHSYYAPSNATLVLAGDIDFRDARRMVEHYFGSLAKRPKPARNTSVTPALGKIERLTLEEPVDLAKVSMGFITPPAFSTDDPALEVAAAVLAGGKATRLYKKLVVEKKLAGEVSAELESNQLCGNFVVSALAASGKKPAEVEGAIDGVLRELAAKGPNDAELERARRRLLVDLFASLGRLNGHDGESGRAGLLQRFNHYLGDPGYLPVYVQRLSHVTARDVRLAVARHLDLDKRVIVTTLPAAKKGAGK
jgi:zinc protease